VNKITVYSTDRCPYCRQAMALLDERDLAYEEVDLSKDEGGRQRLVGLTGMMTFPQVVIGEHLVGGFTELLAASRSGLLLELAGH
jgi:glutaredoxin 3